jgi:pimeloyl-ACP methyl ester carboxylesterase
MLRKIIIFLLLALLCIVAYVFFLRKDLTLSAEVVKERYREPDSKFINWKGAEIHYTDRGSGFPILMIHGFGGSHTDFWKLDSLFHSEYRVIRIDVPGFGMSSFPEKVDAQTDFYQIYNEYFDFLIDTLHLDSFYVMGNSLGGMFAWNLALRQPDKVKKLVLFNSAGYDMPHVLKTAGASIFKNAVVRAALKKGIPEFVTRDGMYRVFYVQSDFNDITFKKINDFWNREGNLNQIFAMASTTHYPDENDIKNINIPTLIVWGKQDVIIDPQYAQNFHKDIKNSELIMYDSCGHVPMLEVPEKAYKDVGAFLREE